MGPKPGSSFILVAPNSYITSNTSQSQSTNRQREIQDQTAYYLLWFWLKGVVISHKTT